MAQPTPRHRSIGARARAEELVARESGALLDYFVRRTEHREDAADLLGDALLVVWRRERSIPADPAEARMWLFGVARRILAGQWRTRRRGAALARQLQAVLVASPPADDPGEFDHVRRAIASLDEVDREIIRLVYWDGFNLAEAARILQMNPATVRSRHARASARLRERLGH